jgi:group I intron endonuclease
MGCIYVIENTVNGKKYIGQTGNLKYRQWRHFNLLTRGKHENSHLQNAFNKYGESAFIFKILVDNLPEHYMDDMERGFIATFRTTSREHGYNLSSGGHKNKKAAPESIEKQRQSMFRLHNNPNYRNPNKGKKRSEEIREKISQFHKGKKTSPETKEKMRLASLGKPKSPEHKAKMRGRKKSPEHTEKHRQSLLAYYANGGTPTKIHRIIDSDGTIWPSIKSFCEVHGVSKPTIYNRLKSGEPYKGLYLKYYDPTIQVKKEA